MSNICDMAAPHRLLLITTFAFVATICGAQGGPPLLTDDPGTVEKGKWELNLAWINTQVRGENTNELPHFDLNHGLSDRAHFKIEVPWIFSSNGGSAINGDGGGSVGVKYRFIDGKDGRPSISTYPQLGFQLSSRSANLGLSDSASNLLLPIQIQWDLKNFSVNADAGLIVQPGTTTSWQGGVAIGKEIAGTEYLAEIHGEGNFSAHQDIWIAQLGLRRGLAKDSTLLLAFGKSFMGSNVDRLTWTSYLGVQFRF